MEDRPKYTDAVLRDYYDEVGSLIKLIPTQNSFRGTIIELCFIP
jgi:hypothetical protein